MAVSCFPYFVSFFGVTLSHFVLTWTFWLLRPQMFDSECQMANYLGSSCITWSSSKLITPLSYLSPIYFKWVLMSFTAVLWPIIIANFLFVASYNTPQWQMFLFLVLVLVNMLSPRNWMILPMLVVSLSVRETVAWYFRRTTSPSVSSVSSCCSKAKCFSISSCIWPGWHRTW